LGFNPIAPVPWLPEGRLILREKCLWWGPWQGCRKVLATADRGAIALQPRHLHARVKHIDGGRGVAELRPPCALGMFELPSKLVRAWLLGRRLSFNIGRTIIAAKL